MRSLLLISLFMLGAYFTSEAQQKTAIDSNSTPRINKTGPISVSDSLSASNEHTWDKYLIINSDSKVDTLLHILKEENIKKDGMDGYRVQIFQGTKEEAYQVKARFISNHENVKAYIRFQSPDFRVRVGDFRTRSEAINLKNKIKNEFPGAFMIEDIINFPDLSETDKGI